LTDRKSRKSRGNDPIKRERAAVRKSLAKNKSTESVEDSAADERGGLAAQHLAQLVPW